MSAAQRARAAVGVRRDRGYVTLFTLGVSMAMVSLVGLVLDGGRAQRAQSDLFGTAAAAARAGAQQLDAVAAVDGAVQLDPEAAATAARDFLTTQGVTGRVTVDGAQITVEAWRHLDYLVLPGGTRLDATATTRITPERAP